jgi:HSP20 family protein
MAEKSTVPVKSDEKAIRRWDPIEQLEALQSELNRLWGDAWPFATRRSTWPTIRPTTAMTTFTPRMDVYEKNGNLVVKADLPGMKAEDVDVSIEEGDLIIKGERSAEKEVKEEDYYRMERSYGSFYRRQPLPDGITPDKIQATFANGVLEVTIPKPAEKKPEPQKIAIKEKTG